MNILAFINDKNKPPDMQRQTKILSFDSVVIYPG